MVACLFIFFNPGYFEILLVKAGKVSEGYYPGVILLM